MAATITTGSDRWLRWPAVAVHSRPAVNSSESPGRKNPISSPVSANSTRKIPSAPRLESSDVELSTLSAPTCAPNCVTIDEITFRETDREVTFAASYPPQPQMNGLATTLL